MSFASQAQDPPLYMPREVQQAYKNKTRWHRGTPTAFYWQNKARYNIEITAAPPSRTIQGKQEIVYFNNSPAPIQYPTFRLLLNIHKPGAARSGNKRASYLTSGVHVDSFSVNGASQTWPDPDGFVLQRVKLPQPVKPGDSVRFSFNWHYDVSVSSNREGMIDSTTFFLAYFYPRIAVNDDISGWDRSTFDDQHEFYSDFNDYTVTVKVPANFIVWGTGSLQQPETLLQPAIVNRYKQSLTSDVVIPVVTKADWQAQRVTTQNAVNAWQFTASNIPDMAFGISDHYVWEAASTIVDDATGRRASVQAAYHDTAKDFPHMARWTQHTLHTLSRNWPGIPYPYEKMTAFQGYADMEYPMMINDETCDSDTTMTKLIAWHEIAHTYMPFYMGINETRYGFMDEGWATTFEYLIGHAENPAVADSLFKMIRVAPMVQDPSAQFEVPVITPGISLTGYALTANQYTKAALAYLAAKDMMGDARFKKSLHRYMQAWNGKHPIPWDFFKLFIAPDMRSIDWFWNNWLFSFHHMDIAVKSLVKGPKGYTLTVDNVGGFAIPFDVQVVYSDGSKDSFHQTPAIWRGNERQATVGLNTNKSIVSLKLDGGIFMDSNEADNIWKAPVRK
ncbi:M1 family metallopeptidase [Paraflavitalea speifideaquila]|uniref:M1 family metallopeptidase n=1 Tax=Paraflavitalea speifideaquila TaxID=3076558 RepID=UPI0028E5127F|nr:M1 family metallopeptidase [Paraflavitalea speifideiaquila]